MTEQTAVLGRDQRLPAGVATATAPRAPAGRGLANPSESYVSLYTELAKTVRESGLLKRRYGFYWSQIAVTVLAFGGIWVGFFLLGHTWYQLILAAALGLVVTQFGFLGHDAAHRQIFLSSVWNAWTARILAGGFAGLSLTWWRAKHNMHHKAPNQEGSDPDIASGVLAFTPQVMAARSGLGAWIGQRQGWLFFPLLTLEGLNLHVASLRTGWSRAEAQPWRRLEKALVIGRLAAYVGVLFYFLPPGIAAAFFGIQMATFGVFLGAAFAPAHKGMPLVPATMKLDFLRRQVMVSRNIRGNPVIDVLMGGLNYQIEHHLFPSMPVCNLKRAQPMIRAHCEQFGVDYTEVGLFRSYAIVIDYLNNVGIRARDPFDCPLAAQLRG